MTTRFVLPLLGTLLVLALAGCGSSGRATDKKKRSDMVLKAPQTGSYIPRWEARRAERKEDRARAKKRSKAKTQKEESTERAGEDYMPRGGFR